MSTENNTKTAKLFSIYHSDLIKSLIAKPKILIGHTEKYDIYELKANGQKLFYRGKTKEQFENPTYWSLS